MASVKLRPACVAGIATCVPARRFDNLRETTEFSPEEVRKVVAMAGVSARHIADESTCSSDLCLVAAKELLGVLGWDPGTVDALVMVTQTPDYFLPSTSCVLHERLGLSDRCAAFDVGLGCSGYPYGLWLCTALLQAGGVRRCLLLHGETPSRFAARADRSVSLLFGDAGSATALVPCEEPSMPWSFVLETDGSGYRDLIIEGGGFRNRNCIPEQHFVRMNGANIFNFTIMRVPPVVEATLQLAGLGSEEVDYYIFHQSNRFIMKHLVSKMRLPPEKVPIILDEYGNAGGPSIPLAITKGGLTRVPDRRLRLMLVGYGVGLSWGSALIDVAPEVPFLHTELQS